jgi:hypothetical protein
VRLLTANFSMMSLIVSPPRAACISKANWMRRSARLYRMATPIQGVIIEAICAKKGHKLCIIYTTRWPKIFHLLFDEWKLSRRAAGNIAAFTLHLSRNFGRIVDFEGSFEQTVCFVLHRASTTLPEVHFFWIGFALLRFSRVAFRDSKSSARGGWRWRMVGGMI